MRKKEDSSSSSSSHPHTSAVHGATKSFVLVGSLFLALSLIFACIFPFANTPPLPLSPPPISSSSPTPLHSSPTPSAIDSISSPPSSPSASLSSLSSTSTVSSSLLPPPLVLPSGVYLIRSVRLDECMFCSEAKLNGHHRYVLTSQKKKCGSLKTQSTKHASDPSLEWEVVRHGVGYTLRNAKCGEYAYANSPMLNDLRRHVLTSSDGESAQARWEITLTGLFYTIRNVRHGECMYVNRPMLDSHTHRVLTWGGEEEELMSGMSPQWEFVWLRDGSGERAKGECERAAH